LWFWAGAWHMAWSHPFLGVGPGNFGLWSPQHLGDVLWSEGGSRFTFNEVHTLHAHCEPLELFAETGFVGVVCAVWMGLRLLRFRGPEWAPLAAALVFAAFNPAFRSTPHALATVLFMGGLMARSDTTAVARRRLYAGVVLVAALFLAVILGWASWAPSYRLRAAEDVHLAGGNPIAAYQALTQSVWPCPEAEQGLAIAYMERDRYDRATEALKRAHQEGMDTGDLWLGMAYCAYYEGDADLQAQYAEKCLHRWPDDEDAWALLVAATPLAKRDTERTRATRFMDDAQWHNVLEKARALRAEMRR